MIILSNISQHQVPVKTNQMVLKLLLISFFVVFKDVAGLGNAIVEVFLDCPTVAFALNTQVNELRTFTDLLSKHLQDSLNTTKITFGLISGLFSRIICVRVPKFSSIFLVI